MYWYSNGQIRLSDFKQPMGMNLKEDNRWVKRAILIPWNDIEKRYAALFTNRKGNVAKPLRLAVGAQRLGIFCIPLNIITGELEDMTDTSSIKHQSAARLRWISASFLFPAMQILTAQVFRLGGFFRCIVRYRKVTVAVKNGFSKCVRSRRGKGHAVVASPAILFIKLYKNICFLKRELENFY